MSTVERSKDLRPGQRDLLTLGKLLTFNLRAKDWFPPVDGQPRRLGVSAASKPIGLFVRSVFMEGGQWGKHDPDLLSQALVDEHVNM